MKRKALYFIFLAILSYSVSAQTVDDLKIHDTRFESTVPDTYYRNLKVNFKYYSAVGLPFVGSGYNAIIGLKGWYDNTGGKAHELAFLDDGQLMVRSGYAPTWEGWRTLLAQNNLGRVGIGIMDPAHTLDVNGTGRFSGRFILGTPWYGDPGEAFNVYGGSYLRRDVGTGNILLLKQNNRDNRNIMAVSSDGSISYELEPKDNNGSAVMTHLYNDRGNGRFWHYETNNGSNELAAHNWTFYQEGNESNIGTLAFRLRNNGVGDLSQPLMKMFVDNNTGQKFHDNRWLYLFDGQYQGSTRGFHSSFGMKGDGTFHLGGMYNEGTDPDKIVVYSGTSLKYMTKSQLGIGGSSGSSLGWALGGNTAINPTSQFIGTTDNQPLIFKTNNSEAFRITPLGQLAIGTTQPNPPTDYKLAVGGGIIAEKIRIKLQGSWADYVFNQHYQLPPLSEVESFIKEHHHLPGVPAKSQLEKEGIDLEETQTILLKKVEELTLYIIEQNKILKGQMEIIEHQGKQLDTLLSQRKEQKK